MFSRQFAPRGHVHTLQGRSRRWEETTQRSELPLCLPTMLPTSECNAPHVHLLHTVVEGPAARIMRCIALQHATRSTATQALLILARSNMLHPAGPQAVTHLYCTCRPLAVPTMTVCWVSVSPSGDSWKVSLPCPAWGSPHTTLLGQRTEAWFRWLGSGLVYLAPRMPSLCKDDSKLFTPCGSLYARALLRARHMPGVHAVPLVPARVLHVLSTPWILHTAWPDDRY